MRSGSPVLSTDPDPDSGAWERATLSVVIPAYNAQESLPGVVQALLDDADRSGWPPIELVLVDDGSQDDTKSCLDRFSDRCRLEVVSQENAGRFQARYAGLQKATGDLVVLLDSRVTVHPDSLEFLRRQVLDGRVVWNAHVTTSPSRALPSHFWDGITAIAWRRYYRHPRHVELTAETYDYFPKGTTMFAAPRTWLLDACAQFGTGVDDSRFANDDTLLLRPLLERDVINLAPEFGCDYESRSTLTAFIRHSYHRGTVLIDGHDRPGSRFRPYIRLTFIATPLAIAALMAKPRSVLAMGSAACLSVGIVARWCGAERRSALALGTLAPVFSVAYFAGMARGELLKVRSLRRGRADR